MFRALGSHGFADLKAAILAYSSFTSVYAVGDPRRFKPGTPDDVFRGTGRAWDVAPTGKRASWTTSPPSPVSCQGSSSTGGAWSPTRFFAMGAALKSGGLLR